MQPTRVPHLSSNFPSLGNETSHNRSAQSGYDSPHNRSAQSGYETPHNRSTQSGYRVNMAYVRNEGDTPSPQQPARAMPASGYQARQTPASGYSQRSLAVQDVPVNESSQYIGKAGDSTPHNLSFQPVGDTTYMSRVDGRPAAPILKAPGFDYLNWKPYDKVCITCKLTIFLV